MKATPKSTRRPVQGFTDDEKSAMRQRVKELQTDTTEGEAAVLARLAEMSDSDRALGKRLHAIITASAPALSPKLYYGMPAYARDGKVVCFYKPSQKFKTRYSTLGFNDPARLDEGNMWPTEFAVMKLAAADEARIAALVKKAAS